MEVLLAAGATVDALGADGENPLHSAARCGRVGVVTALVKAGAGVNALSAGGQSPYHLAARELHPDVAKALVALGADIFTVDSSGRTAFQLRQLGLAHTALQEAMDNMELNMGCASSRLLAVPHCAWQSLCSLHWSLTCGMARGTWQGQHAARG